MKYALTKLLCIAMVICMLLTFAACGEAKKKDDDKGETTAAAKAEQEPTKAPANESTEEPEDNKDSDAEPDTDSKNEESAAYYIHSMELSGETYSTEDLALFMDTESTYIILNSDGTAVMCSDGESIDLEWADGLMWTVDEPDDTQEFVLEGDQLILIAEDNKMIFLAGEMPDPAEPSEPSTSGQPTLEGDIYYLVSIAYDGEVFTAEDMETDPESVYVQLNADGTGALVEDGESIEIEWSGNEMWMAGDDSVVLTFQLNGDELILEQDGVTMTFSK